MQCNGICAYPVTTAGPKALAGLMQLELMGPVIHMLKVMPRAIANGPNLPQPLQARTDTALGSYALCISEQVPSDLARKANLHATANNESIADCGSCNNNRQTGTYANA